MVCWEELLGQMREGDSLRASTVETSAGLPPLLPTLSARLSHLRKPLTGVPWLAATQGSGPGLPLPGLLTRCRQCCLPAAWAKSQLQSAALAPGALWAVSAQQAGPRRRRPPSSGGRLGEQTGPADEEVLLQVVSLVTAAETRPPPRCRPSSQQP